MTERDLDDRMRLLEIEVAKIRALLESTLDQLTTRVTRSEDMVFGTLQKDGLVVRLGAIETAEGTRRWGLRVAIGAAVTSLATHAKFLLGGTP
jgi:hypothetical protein